MKKDQTKIVTIALGLVLVISTLLVILPLVGSQAQGTKQTFAIIDFIPNPAGVNQPILITFGITDFTTRPQEGWEALTVEITKPDGTTETLGPLKTDTTGLSGTTYVPTMVGTYKLQTHFPEQTVTAEEPGRTKPVGTVMLGSISEVFHRLLQWISVVRVKVFLICFISRTTEFYKFDYKIYGPLLSRNLLYFTSHFLDDLTENQTVRLYLFFWSFRHPRHAHRGSWSRD